MSSVILSDFDGTIVAIDTAEFALGRFAQGDWRAVEEEFEKGEITFEECMRKQFWMIKVPEKVILDELDRATSFRPNFENLVEYSRAQRLPFIVVSGGLDFGIRHFLELKGWLEQVEVYAPKAKCTADGIRLTFPKLVDETSISFKEDLVRYYKRQGRKVFYIGNGVSDYPPARNADFTFAVRGSKLAELCNTKGVPHKEIADFQDVVEALEHDS
jgi:2-hydroxy-3-keto-5-methylthiopentenyl-1-phosphate phosphatase